MLNNPKKLIEAAMPIKEISAESVRDKSIRHGHISTLHLWWARRPLPVCRAVVFASLVPDPLDENCPKAFKDAVDILLGKSNNQGDPYKPYSDIPWTTIFDEMEDNLRNRLQMFIGKFSDDMQKHLKGNAPKPAAGKMLSDYSLIKWDNKNNEEIINKARKLIFVSYQSSQTDSALSAEDLLIQFDLLYGNIKQAEKDFYSLSDRHLETEISKVKAKNLENAINAFLEKMPRVFDPFAGGGAIPLEAARLGCQSFGNDLNPVAHIIQKGSLEFPQKYGKPITYSKAEFIKIYGEDEYTKALSTQSSNGFEIITSSQITINNRLSFDVEFYARKLLKLAEAEIGQYYPADENGNKPIAYYWARVGTCSNPSCRAEVPLLKGFYLANTKTKQVYLKPIIKGTQIDFEIKSGKCEKKGWMGKSLICPCCGAATAVKELKNQAVNQGLKERLTAVIVDSENGKGYRLPTVQEKNISNINKNLINPLFIPNEDMNPIPDLVSGRGWGINKWSQMFSPRQLLSMQTLVSKLQEIKAELKPQQSDYAKAVVTYLSFIINKSADYNSSFCTWHSGREVIGHVFTKQAIQMVFDFPEVYPLTKSSGGIYNMIDWISRYIKSEPNDFWAKSNNASSGDKSQFPSKFLTTVITDPPYYDAIAYADLSDFFYVWFKRILSDIYPLNFATPQTPKSEECTALKHHHDNSKEKAKSHFENKLLQIFDAIEYQTSDIVSIMFAHQSTEAWTTLCNSILGARMNITGSWAIDTEMANRTLGLAGAVLASSVTVSCKPAQRQGIGDYKDVKKAVEKTVSMQVDELYRLGFRGADLLTACFGQAVSEFGKYEQVEKADGSTVTVADLLDMAKESAFNALLKGFDGDDFTKFYIGWLQLYSFTETDFDDAAKFSRVGLNVNVGDLFKTNIFIKNGNKQTLGTFEDRAAADKKLGIKEDSFLIDKAHRAMALYKGTNRANLTAYIKEAGSDAESSFWRVLTSLCEVLPNGCDDHKQASGLINNKDSLIRESKESVLKLEQSEMF